MRRGLVAMYLGLDHLVGRDACSERAAQGDGQETHDGKSYGLSPTRKAKARQADVAVPRRRPPYGCDSVVTQQTAELDGTERFFGALYRDEISSLHGLFSLYPGKTHINGAGSPRRDHPGVGALQRCAGCRTRPWNIPTRACCGGSHGPDENAQ